MALVAAKSEKVAVNIQGPYCELPGPGPIQGHCRGLSATMTRTADGIIIVAGEEACGLPKWPYCQSVFISMVPPCLPHCK